jgi:HEPN domain-containing protein
MKEENKKLKDLKDGTTALREKSKHMNMSMELLKIAKEDLQASKVLYENGLYPQAIFYFQQSVEKANKAFALITKQVKENELLKEVGHDTINIYDKSTKHLKKECEQIKENLNILPELKAAKIFKGFNIDKNLRQFEIYSSQIKKIKEGKKELIYIPSRDIRHFLKEIESAKKDSAKAKRAISKFKITERDWNKMKKDMSEMYDVFSKFDPTLKESKSDLESTDMKLLVENLIKSLIEPISIIPITIALYYLAIVTLPHVSITRYPQNDRIPAKIYTKKLPIVKMLPELIGVQADVLDELKILNKKFEGINAGGLMKSQLRTGLGRLKNGY